MLPVFERDVPQILFWNGHFGHLNPRFDDLKKERKLLAKEYIHFFCKQFNIETADIEQLCQLLTLSPRSVKYIPYNVLEWLIDEITKNKLIHLLYLQALYNLCLFSSYRQDMLNIRFLFTKIWPVIRDLLHTSISLELVNWIIALIDAGICRWGDINIIMETGIFNIIRESFPCVDFVELIFGLMQTITIKNKDGYEHIQKEIKTIVFAYIGYINTDFKKTIFKCIYQILPIFLAKKKSCLKKWRYLYPKNYTRKKIYLLMKPYN